MSIQFKRGKSTAKSSSQTLLAGQPFYETDTKKLYVSGTNTTLDKAEVVNANDPNAAHLDTENTFTKTQTFGVSNGYGGLTCNGNALFKYNTIVNTSTSYYGFWVEQNGKFQNCIELYGGDGTGDYPARIKVRGYDNEDEYNYNDYTEYRDNEIRIRSDSDTSEYIVKLPEAAGTLATLDDTKEKIYEIISSSIPTLTSPSTAITVSTDIKLAIAKNPKNVVLSVKTSSTDTNPKYFKYDRPNYYNTSSSTWSYVYKYSNGHDWYNITISTDTTSSMANVPAIYSYVGTMSLNNNQSFAGNGIRYDKASAPGTDDWGETRTATSVNGCQSLAFGGSVHTYADWGVAFGADTRAYMKCSTVSGKGNQAGPKTTAERTDYTVPSTFGNTGNPARSEKLTHTWSYGEYADARASGVLNKAIGFASDAGNGENIAFGHYSTAKGYQNVAGGDHSTTIGANNFAKGQMSFAGGNGCIASGEGSFAIGKGSQALGNYSVAIGEGTIANGDNQLVIGQYNETAPTGTSLVIGCGTSSNRKNVMLVANNAVTVKDINSDVYGYVPNMQVTQAGSHSSSSQPLYNTTTSWDDTANSSIIRKLYSYAMGSGVYDQFGYLLGKDICSMGSRIHSYANSLYTSNYSLIWRSVLPIYRHHCTLKTSSVTSSSGTFVAFDIYTAEDSSPNKTELMQLLIGVPISVRGVNAGSDVVEMQYVDSTHVKFVSKYGVASSSIAISSLTFNNNDYGVMVADYQ